MPGMNNTDSKQIIGTLPKSEEKDPTQPETPREITQTDHLNKKLLTVFLEKINETSSSIISQEATSCNNDNEFL